MNGTHEDDWFSEPDVAESPTRPSEPLEDDWLAELPTRRRPLIDRRIFGRRGLVSLVAAVVLVVALLAATGAFNSSSRRTTTTPLTSATTSPTAATTRPAKSRSAAAAPSTTLSPGDRRAAEVRLLQRALASLGYSTGAADGSYGPTTQQAVAAFQRASGLKADGILGSKTLRALKLALRGS